MTDSESKIPTDFSGEEKRLFTLLLIYCIVVSICRLFGPGMRYIAYVDWTVYRKDLIARLPYYLAPFIGLAWLQWSRFGRGSLFFVAGTGLTGILNHGYAAAVSIMSGAPFFRLTGNESPVRMNVLTATGLAVIFALFAYGLFRSGKRLYTQKPLNKIWSPFIAFLVLILCHIAPFIDYKDVATLVTPYKNVAVIDMGSGIRHMGASPDGKFLAVGTKSGLSVWDAESQQCVWSDDSVAVQRVRFSLSGKYLAAAGRGIPEGSSDLAVFEVNGFRRIPNFDWPEEDLRKEKIIHDIGFRPDEKSLLIAWHREWDWKQMSHEAALALRRKESDEARNIASEDNGKKLDLICTELDIISREILCTKVIKPLSPFYDLLEEGGVYFLPNASFLLYPKWHNHWGFVARNRLYLADTRTWTEEEILLDRKYSMRTGTVGTNWYAWDFTQNGDTAYFLARETDARELGGGMNDRAFLLMKFDFKTRRSDEILRVPVTRSFERNPWHRIALSPDEKQIALLGFGETLYNYGDMEKRIIVVRLLDLESGETKQLVYKHDFTRFNMGARRIVWLSRDMLALAIFSEGRGGGFFFINIGKPQF
jgi:hypothetical protein